MTLDELIMRLQDLKTPVKKIKGMKHLSKSACKGDEEIFIDIGRSISFNLEEVVVTDEGILLR